MPRVNTSNDTFTSLLLIHTNILKLSKKVFKCARRLRVFIVLYCFYFVDMMGELIRTHDLHIEHRHSNCPITPTHFTFCIHFTVRLIVHSG